jgi:hypothetical protein
MRPTFLRCLKPDNHVTRSTGALFDSWRLPTIFYTASVGDWIYIELSNAALKFEKKAGIMTRFQEPKPVENQPVEDTWSDWRCPYISNSRTAAGVVTKMYPLKRDEAGTFLVIEGDDENLSLGSELKQTASRSS